MGRHRKASNRRRVVAFAALPVASALPMLAAAPASATAESVWDTLATCESTNNWSINTGNGYYGGLQFSDRTWDAFNRKYFPKAGYPGRADLASKSQQIAVAEKVQDEQGWDAWPGCNAKLGLAGLAAKAGGSSASVKETPSKSRTTTRASRSYTRTAVAKVKTTKTAKTSVSRVKKSVPTATVKRSAGLSMHMVKAGDTLSGIASMHRIAGGWRALAKINQSVVKDANLIYPGQLLRLVGDRRRI